MNANRLQLGDFLRRRREERSPAAAGLPPSGRRRTPATTSAFEQGRKPVPSATVLAGIADALRLTTDERTHMYTLAGQPPPSVADGAATSIRAWSTSFAP